MKSDISRDTFQSTDKYASVRLQQGRVLVDADWNEQVDIRSYQDRQAVVDAIGESGAPVRNPGLAVSAIGGGSGLSAAPGRYYIEGIAVDTDAAIDFTSQSDLPDYQPPSEDGVYLAYAETREVSVSALDAPELVDPALGGFDTTTRSRSLLQLKLLRDGDVGDVPDCLVESPAWIAFRDSQRSATQARLKARLRPNASTGQAGEYTGEQNALYRIEIHRGGAPGTATFKWSRSNAAEALEWIAQNGDELSVRGATPRRSYFAPGDWLEVLDESFELTNRPGGLVQILADDGDTIRVKADSYISFDGGSPALDIADFTGGRRRVRRWSMIGESGELSTEADPTVYTTIEHGIEVAFTAESESLAAGEFRTGDAWLIPARAVSRDIEWPARVDDNAGGFENDFAPAMFPRRAFARLAYVQRSAGVWSVLGDCRRIFPTLADANLVYHSGDGQEGLPGAFLDEALLARVASGSVPVCDARVRFTIAAGAAEATLEDLFDASNSGASVDVLTDAEGLAGVRWRIDPTTAQPRVEASLLDESGTPTPLLIRFNAGLSVAARLEHAPSPVLDPAGSDLMAGVTNVREALDRLEAIKADRAGDTIAGSLNVDEDLTVQGQLTVQGDVIAKDLAQTPGDVVLGDQDADRISVHGQLTSEHLLDAVVVDDAVQVREDLLVDGAVGPRSGIGIGEATGDWKYRVSLNVASSVSNAPYSRKSQQLYASDGAVGDLFGTTFAVDGEWMLVGASGDEGQVGSAYFLRYEDGRWVERQKIVSPTAAPGDRFGYAVTMQGDIAVVSAVPAPITSNPGRAYVFLRNGQQWLEIQQLFSVSLANGDGFGTVLDMHGDSIAVGAPGSNGGVGASYVFRRENGVYEEQARFTPPLPGASNTFDQVSIKGDVLAIGDYNRNSVFVYRRTGISWSLQQTLTGGSEAWFGVSVAVDAARIAVGAAYEDGNAAASEGAAYIFDFDGASWNQSARLTALDGQGVNRFGRSLDLAGDAVIIGAQGDDNAEGVDAGAAYVFTRAGASWNQTRKVSFGEESPASAFGRQVRLVAGVAYVGNEAAPSAPLHLRAGTLTVVPEVPESLINYQHELTLNTAQLVAAGKMNADGSDILFMNEDDLIPLPYWIESGMNSATTKIWVRLPAIPAGGSTRIFLHYGNENAAPRSSTAETFLGEIEALGGAWQIEDGAGTVVRDLSGNGNDGAIQGQAVWTDDGRFGTSLQFNGTDNGILLPSGNLAGGGSDPVSVSMWWYSDNDWAGGETRTPWQFAWDASQFYSVFWDRAGGPAVNIFFRESLHYIIPIDLNALTGRWNHFVGVYTGGDKRAPDSFVYYMNGVRLPLSTVVEGEVGDGPPYDSRLGSSANGGTPLQFWDGRLNHMQVYRRALTDQEVAQLNNSYGYATPEYPGRILLRTHADTAPVVSVEDELPAPFALPQGWRYRKALTLKNDFSESYGAARRSLEVGSPATLLAPAGDQLLVGSYLEGGGVVRVLERDPAGRFAEVQTFAGSGLSAGDGFGISIDVEGDVAVVGASGANSAQGAVYVFERNNGVWFESARLVGDAPTGANLGGAVAVAGDYVFGGGEAAGSSSVRVFYNDPTIGWTQTQLLTTSESNPADRAWLVAATGDTAVVGAINHIEGGGGGSHNGGAAFVFRLDSDTGVWTETQKLVPSVRSPGDRFGIFPSIHENTIAIGADDSPNGAGALYLFEERGGRWTETARLTAPDGAVGDRFGFRSYVAGDAVVTAAHFQHNEGFPDVGVAYVFPRTGSGWGPATAITPGEFSRDNLYFGYDSAILNDSVVVSTFPGTGVGEVLQFERLRPQTIDDVQVPIELDTFGLIADRKLRSDGDDLLITDGDGLRPLPHYIEGGLNSSSTKVWARIPGLRAGESKNIFVHYGNPGAVARGSANETFVRVIDGVAAACPLDESAGTRVFDASGNDNDGLMLGPIRDAGVFEGRFNGALEFDGANDYVELRDHPTVDVQADITVSCWFRCDGPGTGLQADARGELIAKHKTTGQFTFNLAVVHVPEPRLSLDLFDTGNGDHRLSSNSLIEYGRWYFAVGTYEKSTRELRVYLNAELDNSRVEPAAFDLQQSAIPLALGAYQETSGAGYRSFLKGALAEPRVYARALSEGEVRDLFENRGDARLAANSRAEFVRRRLAVPPLALPAATEERIAYEPAGEWSYRRAIAIDNTAAVSQDSTKLTAFDGDNADYFGGQVCIADDYAFLSAPGDDDQAPNAGAVYVYRFQNAAAAGESGWIFDAKLTASDGGSNHGLANNIHYSQGSVLLTASAANRCYVFERAANAWIEQVVPTIPSPEGFGYAGDIEGDRVVIAAHGEDVGGVVNAGAVYVFDRSGGVWTQSQRLQAGDRAAEDAFGSAVALTQDLRWLAVGKRGDGGGPGDQRGAVYMFEWDGGSYVQRQKLTLSNQGNSDFLGEALDVDGDTLVATAYGRDGARGAGYVYNLVGDEWVFAQELTASDRQAGDHFGGEVRITGDRILFGSNQAGNGEPGRAVIFRRDGQGPVESGAQAARRFESR
jgi:hypothetical protein